MTFKDSLVEAWNGLQCKYGNHEWENYLCHYTGFHQLLFTRECKYCHKIEGSKKAFKGNKTYEESSQIYCK
jgi:hypothetical protein